MRGIICTESKKRTISITKMLNEVGEEKAKNILLSFSCARDKDIQNFLHNRAILFEKLLKSRTYLVVSDEEFQSPGFAYDKFTIYGYISLAVKIFTAPEEISNRQRKELNGLSSKEHGKKISNFPCYLIGQLARNSNVPKETISGAELLDCAYNIIGQAVRLVGGRNILVESRNVPGLIQFYLDNGFYKISQVPDENQPMIQMIRKIDIRGYAD